MNKIIVRIKGGLGNQLFCYSAARRLAVINNCELVIDDTTGLIRNFNFPRKYSLGNFNISARIASSRERLEPFGRYRRWINRKFSKIIAFNQRSYIEDFGNDFDPRLLNLKVTKNTYLDGYWQSESYFKDIENVIRADLEIIPPVDDKNIELAEKIRGCTSVAIHVRWFDPPGAASACNLDSGYYQRAIEVINSKLKTPHYFIFSEDIEASRDMLNLPPENFTCVSHNVTAESDFADMWLMSQCQHFIIANSTFSWWGAWLGKYGNKIIISPNIKKDGIGSWGFKDLIPETWIRL